MDIESYTKNYFGSLSSISEKIAADIRNTEEAYQHLWDELNKAEQAQLIDESIITPDAVIRYANIPAVASKSYPYSYSWFTKSQQSLPELEEPVIVKPVRSSASVEMAKVTIANRMSHCEKPAGKGHKSILKPKTPPPPPPAKSAEVKMEPAADDIPKSGFDFLDNW